MFFSKSDKTVNIAAGDLQPGFVIYDDAFEGERYVVLHVNTEGEITQINLQYIRGAEAPAPHNPMVAVELYYQHPIPVEK